MPGRYQDGRVRGRRARVLLRPSRLVRRPLDGRASELRGVSRGHIYKNLCVDDKLDLSGVTVNTNLVPPSQYPKTWADLLKPYWKGKIVLSNPAPGGYYLAVGADHEEGVRPQVPEGDRGSAALAPEQLRRRGPGRGVGREGLSVLSQIDSPAAALQKAGAPLKWLLIRNPDVGSRGCVGILKNGPHPNAARVLLNYLMSAGSQGAACQAGVPNISPLNAKGCWPPAEDVRLPDGGHEAGNYPGINNKNLKYAVLHALGL